VLRKILGLFLETKTPLQYPLKLLSMAESQAGVVKNKAKEVFHDESAQFNLSSQFYQEIPTQNFAFVNLTASSGTTQDSDKRRLVRSHVMRNAHQQKQMQEYGEGQVQRAILPRNIPLVVQGWPAFEHTGMGTFTQQDGAEPEFGTIYKDLDWNPIPNSVPNQSIHGMKLVAQGSWTSETSIPANETGTPTGDMTLEPGSSNLGNIQHYETTHNEDGDVVGLLAELEELGSEILNL